MTEPMEGLRDPGNRAVEAVANYFDEFIARKAARGIDPFDAALNLSALHYPKGTRISSEIRGYANGYFPPRALIDEARSEDAVRFDNGMRLGLVIIREGLGDRLREYWEWLVIDAMNETRPTLAINALMAPKLQEYLDYQQNYPLSPETLAVIGDSEELQTGVGFILKAGVAARLNVDLIGERACRNASMKRAGKAMLKYTGPREISSDNTIEDLLGDAPRVWRTGFGEDY